MKLLYKLNLILLCVIMFSCNQSENRSCRKIQSQFDSIPINISKNRYLLLDSRVVECVKNLELNLGEVKKHEENPLFGEDKSWEPRFDNVYSSVIYDKEEEIYKCWYNPFIIDGRTSSTPLDQRHPDSSRYMKRRPKTRLIGICYAYSKDGLSWIKPNLGLIEYEGSKANNIVMNKAHGVDIIKDEQEKDPDKRYKAFFSSFDFKGNKDITVAFSADGIHWSDWVTCASVKSMGDTHNNAFWDPKTKKYRGYTRAKSKNGARIVTYTESEDFINWTKHYEVFRHNDSNIVQAHDMMVFQTEGIYIGLIGAMVFPDDMEKPSSGPFVRQHVQLAWSPDGINWSHVKENVPFIPNGEGPNPPSYGDLPYDWGTIFASKPIFLKDEVRLYYGACDWYFFDWRKGYLALATIRPDGWAGYEQIMNSKKTGSLTTIPVKVITNVLAINADVNPSGKIKVKLLTKKGKLLATSKLITETGIDIPIKWSEDFSLESIKGQEVKLKFELSNSKLYSFSFH